MVPSWEPLRLPLGLRKASGSAAACACHGQAWGLLLAVSDGVCAVSLSLQGERVLGFGSETLGAGRRRQQLSDPSCLQPSRRAARRLSEHPEHPSSPAERAGPLGPGRLPDQLGWEGVGANEVNVAGIRVRPGCGVTGPGELPWAVSLDGREEARAAAGGDSPEGPVLPGLHSRAMVGTLRFRKEDASSRWLRQAGGGAILGVCGSGQVS